MKESMRRAHQSIRDLMNSAGPDLATQRKAYDTWGEQFPLPSGTIVEALASADGLAVSTSRSEADRVVVYLHGGAYRMGSSRSHQEIAARVADAARAVVVVPDYPLAPEHPFPAAVEYVRDLYAALVDEVPARRLAVAGESAGGGLAIATLLRLKDEGLRLPAAAAVNSPWVDTRLTPHVWHHFSSWLPEARESITAIGDHIYAHTR